MQKQSVSSSNDARTPRHPGGCRVEDVGVIGRRNDPRNTRLPVLLCALHFTNVVCQRVVFIAPLGCYVPKPVPLCSGQSPNEATGEATLAVGEWPDQQRSLPTNWAKIEVCLPMRGCQIVMKLIRGLVLRDRMAYHQRGEREGHLV